MKEPYCYKVLYYRDHNNDHDSVKSQHKLNARIQCCLTPDTSARKTIVEMILTQKDEIIVYWYDKRYDSPAVQALMQTVEAYFKENYNTPTTSPEEKALQDMVAWLRTQEITLNLFGKNVPLIRASAPQEYLNEHKHDFYDYTNMQQPEICVHDSHSICMYPIEDCKNCPLGNGEMPFTSCQFM